MRKHLLTIAAVLCCWVTMMAEPVTPEAARQAAVKFLNKKGTALKSEAMRKTQRTQPSQSMNAYYVFNATGSQGFVVVAGDDCVGDNLVLGYCDSGSFDAEAIPANMQAWLDDVAGQITLLAGSGAKAQRVAVHEDIAPLVTCHWDQSFPYNALCPMKEGGQSVTGCVATALAQVIYYHRWPQEPIVGPLPSYINYRDSTTVEALPSVAFDWDNMLDDYDGTANEAQCMAVATLMRYCGQAAQMGYTPVASSAKFIDLDMLVHNFGYDAGATIAFASSYSVQGWYDLLYNELREGRPLHFNASSTGGGHAFVVDGYTVSDGEPYFHVNWGWSGSSNGYFKLTLMNPNSHGTGASSTDDGYTNDQRVIAGLQPAKTSLDDYGLCLVGIEWNKTQEDVPHQIGVLNTAGHPATFLVAFAERQADGTADLSRLYGEKTIETPAYANVTIKDCPCYFGLPGNIAGELAAGTHNLAVVYKEAGIGAAWREIFGPTYTIELTVKGDGTAEEPVFHPCPKLSAAAADIRINGPLQTNLPHSASAIVNNSGDEAIQPLKLSAYLVDDGILTSREVNVKTTVFSEAGTATDILFEGISFPKAGNYVVIITMLTDDADFTGMTLDEAMEAPAYIGHTLAIVEPLPFTCEGMEYLGKQKNDSGITFYAISCQLTNGTTMDYDCALMGKIYRLTDEGGQELVNLNGNGYTLSLFALAANTQGTGVIMFLDELQPGNYIVELLICNDFQANPMTTPISSYVTIATLPFTITQATAIHATTMLGSDESCGTWYTLDGRLLEGKPTKEGLYIHHGNKVVVK